MEGKTQKYKHVKITLNDRVKLEEVKDEDRKPLDNALRSVHQQANKRLLQGACNDHLVDVYRPYIKQYDLSQKLDRIENKAYPDAEIDQIKDFDDSRSIFNRVVSAESFVKQAIANRTTSEARNQFDWCIYCDDSIVGAVSIQCVINPIAECSQMVSGDPVIFLDPYVQGNNYALETLQAASYFVYQYALPNYMASIGIDKDYKPDFYTRAHAVDLPGKQMLLKMGVDLNSDPAYTRATNESLGITNNIADYHVSCTPYTTLQPFIAEAEAYQYVDQDRELRPDYTSRPKAVPSLCINLCFNDLSNDDPVATKDKESSPGGGFGYSL